MTIRILIITVTFLMFGCISNSQTNKIEKIDELITLATKSDSLMDFTSSIKYYTEILELDSTKLIALNNRGRALVWLEQLDKGFRDFDKAIKLYPHEKTYYTRGMVYLKIGSYDKALCDLMKSIELNSKFGEPYYGLSLMKIQQDNLDSALLACDKADNISCIPKLSHQMRYMIYQKKGDFKSAINELNKLIKLDPLDPNNYNDRGLTKNQLKQYKEAIIDFDYAIKLNPKMAFAFNNKAFALLNLKQLDDALVNVNTSLELNNKNAYALKNRGAIFIALNSKYKACTDLIEAEKLSNDNDLTTEIKQLKNNVCKE